MSKSKLKTMIYCDNKIEAEAFDNILQKLQFGAARINNLTTNLPADLNTYDLVVLLANSNNMEAISVLNLARENSQNFFLPFAYATSPKSQEAAALCQEFPITIYLESPNNQTLLEIDVLNIIKQKKWYYSNHHRLTKSLNDVSRIDNKNKMRDAVKAFLERNEKGGMSMAFLLLDVANANEKFEISELVCRWILDRDSNNLKAAAQLGRVLFLLGRIEEARPYLRIAKRICSTNLERLSMIGEIALSSNNLSVAEESFKDALKISPGYYRASVGLVVCKTLSQISGERSGQMMNETMAKTYNLAAVAHAQSGDYNDAISIYEASLKMTVEPIIKARISFNLGLCYLRWEKKDEALKWFKISLEFGGKNFDKASKYLNNNEAKLILNATSKPSLPPVTDKEVDEFANFEERIGA